MIYYVNDSDGDTILYENMLDMDDDSQWRTREVNAEDAMPPPLDKFVELKRVAPKQGRVLVFDGFRYHTAMQPQTSDKRIVINGNAIAKL